MGESGTRDMDRLVTNDLAGDSGDDGAIDPDATVLERPRGAARFDPYDSRFTTLDRKVELGEGSSGGAPREDAATTIDAAGPPDLDTAIDPEGTLLGYASTVPPSQPAAPARAPAPAAPSHDAALYPEDTPFPAADPDVGLNTIDTRPRDPSAPALPLGPPLEAPAPRRSWFRRLLDWFRGRRAPVEEAPDDGHGSQTYTVIERMVQQRRPRQ